MLISNIASGVTVLVNKEIETSVQKLMFDVAFTDATVYTESATDLKAMLTAALGTANLTVSHQNNSNTEAMIPKVTLLELAELSTNNEGVVRVDRDEAADTTRIRFTIELSNDGCLPLDDNSKIIMNIESKVSTSTYSISALDYPENSTKRIVYEKKYLNANVPADIDTKGTDQICFPVENLVELRLCYNNSKEVVFTKEELKQQLFDAQDCIMVLNGRSFFGYLNQAIVNVEFCWKVKLTLDASTNYHVIKTK